MPRVRRLCLPRRSQKGLWSAPMSPRPGARIERSLGRQVGLPAAVPKRGATLLLRKSTRMSPLATARRRTVAVPRTRLSLLLMFLRPLTQRRRRCVTNGFPTWPGACGRHGIAPWPSRRASSRLELRSSRWRLPTISAATRAVWSSLGMACTRAPAVSRIRRLAVESDRRWLFGN